MAQGQYHSAQDNRVLDCALSAIMALCASGWIHAALEPLRTLLRILSGG